MPLRTTSSRRLLSAALLAGTLSSAISAPADDPPLNIIHLFADDLGYGDVGYNGQGKILTPNLDRLAAESLKFSRAYAAPVCGPSRGMLLTGLHNGHAAFDRNSQNDRGMPASERTVAEVLKTAGYTTAVFGKWGSGEDRDNPGSLLYPEALPTNQGFDTVYGYLNHNEAKEYFAPHLWRSAEGHPHGLERFATGANPATGTGYSHDLIAAAAESWLAQAAAASETGTPFYLQMSYTIPHFDLDAIADLPDGLDPYRDRPWNDKQKKRAAMITRMDAAIGRLLDIVQDPDQDGDPSDSIADRTLVVFTSDNGPTDVDGSDWIFFNSSGPYRGGKRDLFEGGIRVSALFSLPGTISPGADTTTLTDLADFLPTAADLAGLERPPGLDGVSLWPRLRGDTTPAPARPHLVFEHHEWDGPDPDTRDPRWTVIQSRYKLIRFADGSLDLFDIPADPAETTNLASTLPGVVADLTAIAIREGLEQPEGYNLLRRDWDAGPSDLRTVLRLENDTAFPAIETLDHSRDLLGLELLAPDASQTLRLTPGVTLHALNDIQLHPGSRLLLEHAAVRTKRLHLAPDATLQGVGLLTGTLVLHGTLAPGWPDDVPVTVDPPPYDTGPEPVTLLEFDFSGVQDVAPVNATTVLNAHLALIRGLDFGPGIQPRGGISPTQSNVGDEFNTSLFNAESLAAAILEGDYWGFAVTPDAGYRFTPHTVSVDLWRNGENSASEYALLTRHPGFTADQAHTSIQVHTSGPEARQVYPLDLDSPEPLPDTLDLRIYGWNSINLGNTHLQGVRLSGRIQRIPIPPHDTFETLELDGDLILHPAARLELELQADGDSDRIRVTGRLHADGHLHVTCPGPPPGPGASFQLLEAGEFNGDFHRITLPRLEDGHGWDLEDLRGRGILRVVQAEGFHTWISGAGLASDQQGPEIDDEPDGTHHLAEYVFGTRPGHPDRPALFVDASPDGFAMRWQRPAGRGDVPFAAQRATRLQPADWTDLPPAAITLTLNGDGTESVEILDPAPGSTSFLRLRIQTPPESSPSL